MLFAAQGGAVGGKLEADASGFEIALYDLRGFCVELAVQQVAGGVHDGHVHALAGQADGGFKSQ